jgi:hypothetical protein
MAKYEAYNIQYDTDREDAPDLPKTVTFEAEDDEDAQMYGCDKISDETGWCVSSFEFKRLAEQMRTDMHKTVYVSGGRFILEGNTIRSENLKEVCPYCRNTDCYANCDGAQGDIDGLESEEQMHAREVSNHAIDAVESLVLALHLSGQYDIEAPAFIKAVETTLDSIGNNLG